MSKIKIESFNKKISLERVLCDIKGVNTSPTIIVLAGIHGNETAGVHAVKNLLSKVESQAIAFNGNLHVLSGNLNALEKNCRYEEEDLNRLWTEEHIAYINSSQNGFNADVKEQIAIYESIKTIINNNEGPFYFLDLHTTSSITEPFITISDSLNNRKFSSNFSIPIVLGIEEYLDGPLLTYINEFGHVALGFEGGQHDDIQSVINCEAFLWMSLVISGCLDKDKVENYDKYEQTLVSSKHKNDFYEIDYRYLISEEEDFKMNRGFVNFDDISKNQLLATSNSKEIRANMRGEIFMPLYQKQGKDGFFIITKITSFWLKLSTLVRRLKLHHLLRLLPGIYKERSNSFTLIVNPKTAKFMATEIFHLFGYRKQIVKDNKLHFIKRDRKVTAFK